MDQVFEGNTEYDEEQTWQHTQEVAYAGAISSFLAIDILDFDNM